MTQEKYGKGKYLISIMGKNLSFVVDKSRGNNFFGVKDREHHKTIEEAWESMMFWMDKNTLRAELGETSLSKRV